MDPTTVNISLENPDLASGAEQLSEGDKVTIEGTVVSNGEGGLEVQIDEIGAAQEEGTETPATETEEAAPAARPRRTAPTKNPTDFAIAQRQKRMGKSSMPGNMPMSGAGY